MANFGGGGKFVVIVADGIQKYKKNLEQMAKKNMPVYMTEKQQAEIKKLHDDKYPHMSISAMIIEIVMRETKKRSSFRRGM